MAYRKANVENSTLRHTERCGKPIDNEHAVRGKKKMIYIVFEVPADPPDP